MPTLNCPSADFYYPTSSDGRTARHNDFSLVALRQSKSELANVALKPGVTATVDVRTGQRSVLKYLAKPVYKAFGGAMNER